MTCHSGLKLTARIAFVIAVLFAVFEVPASTAAERGAANALSDFSARDKDNRNKGQARGGRSMTSTPRLSAPRASAPQTFKQHSYVPRPQSPKFSSPRNVTPRVQSAPAVRSRFAAPARGPVAFRGANFVRGPHYTYWQGARRRLIVITAISAILIGGSYYYPYGYLPVGQPICYGLTPDGCDLRWIEVPTVDGFMVPQCVAFCPWQ